MGLNQLRQLRNLNVELLEILIHTLSFIDNYCREHSIPIPKDRELQNLVRYAIKLIGDINAEIVLPSNVQQLLSDENLHRDESNGELTEPEIKSFINRKRATMLFHTWSRETTCQLQGGGRIAKLSMH